MKRPAIDAVWMISPSCCARMNGSATVTQYSAADRLPCTSVSMLSGVSLSQCRSTMFTPALFTRMSSRSNVALDIGADAAAPAPCRSGRPAAHAPGRLSCGCAGPRPPAVRAASGQDDGGAFLGQRQGGGLADAGAGAGDPGDLSRRAVPPASLPLLCAAFKGLAGGRARGTRARGRPPNATHCVPLRSVRATGFRVCRMMRMRCLPASQPPCHSSHSRQETSRKSWTCPSTCWATPWCPACCSAASTPP